MVVKQKSSCYMARNVLSLRMSTLQENLDLLIYFTQEAPLSPEEALERVQGLFPLFDPMNAIYASKVTPLFLDIYECNRGLGLTIDECAAQLEISGNLLVRLLHGEGLDIEAFAKLAKAERTAISEFKRTHLDNINNYATTDEKQGWKASVALLEKVLPSQYGIQLTMFGESGASSIDDDMDAEVSADIYLRELRKASE